MKKILFLMLSLTMLGGCARDLSSNVYTSDSTLSLTLPGKVLSVRKVTIKNTDQLGNNVGGGLAGGALGAAGGSAIGQNSGQAAAVVGGAIVGAVAGAVIQDQLGKDEGFEYIIKVDTTNLKDGYYEGSPAMRNAISAATTSGLVTVVQGQDTILQKEQPVYVIFSGNRTRVIAAE